MLRVDFNDRLRPPFNYVASFTRGKTFLSFSCTRERKSIIAPCCHDELAGAEHLLAIFVFFWDVAFYFGGLHASLTGADHVVVGITSSCEILRGAANGQVLFHRWLSAFQSMPLANLELSLLRVPHGYFAGTCHVHLAGPPHPERQAGSLCTRHV